MHCRYLLLISGLLSTPFSVSAYATTLEQIVVTATREAKSKSELAESIGVLSEEQLQLIMPGHPSEALNRIAGVYINNLGGGGHMTAIRQPLTTSGVYLYLEDGIPTRPTGFFNHNALYEVNVAQASQIEVTKGPGSALYGSDAIGGIINSITPIPSAAPDALLTLEAGEHNWQRALFSGSTAISDNSRLGAQVNITDNDGFRDESDYSRDSANIRWDIDINDKLFVKTTLSYNEVNQSGISSLKKADFKHNDTKNLFHNDIAFRDVEALRLSSEWQYQASDDQLLSITPYYRNNSMELMPSWMITYDPNVQETKFETFGLLSRFRQKLPQHNIEWISGIDVDYSPAEYLERRISLTKQGDIYTDYQFTGRTNYDYEANQLTISPYFHSEWQANEQWLFSAGIRYDYFEIDYSDKLDSSISEVGVFAPIPWPTRHFRPEDQTTRYDQWSPKFGLIYTINDQHNSYVNYRHAFRAPTIGNLFRSGAGDNSDELKPVQADSIEIGLRGELSPQLSYELAAYHMDIEDDIVGYIDNISLTRKYDNAGKTRHRGIEILLDKTFNAEWSSTLAFSYSKQTYESFSTLCGGVSCDFTGNELSQAPRRLANLSLRYAPLALEGLHLELEWRHLDKFYTDQTNEQTYKGYDLVNLRGSYTLNEQWEIFTRLHNVTDQRYSSHTSNTVGSSELDYRPGMPRSLFAGVKIRF